MAMGVSFDPPNLRNTLVLWDRDRCRAVMQPATVDGQRYDGRMTAIRANHAALVAEGVDGCTVNIR